MEISYRDALKVVRQVKKAQKTADKVLRKLKENPGASYQQRQSWKYHLARLMKLKPTNAESVLDKAMRQSPVIMKGGFKRQRQVGPYIVDFGITSIPGARKIAIEADGAIHETRKEYDAARDRYMASKGWQILRFSNAEIHRDVKAVVEKIEKLILEP